MGGLKKQFPCPVGRDQLFVFRIAPVERKTRWPRAGRADRKGALQFLENVGSQEPFFRDEVEGLSLNWKDFQGESGLLVHVFETIVSDSAWGGAPNRSGVMNRFGGFADLKRKSL